jgi:hypothetical protein
MHRVILLALVLVSGPAVASPIEESMNAWRACLEASFAKQQAETTDKNRAVERSMQACSKEEREARARQEPISDEVFDQEKTTVKNILFFR